MDWKFSKDSLVSIQFRLLSFETQVKRLFSSRMRLVFLKMRSPWCLKCIGKKIQVIFFGLERGSTKQHLCCAMGWDPPQWSSRYAWKCRKEFLEKKVRSLQINCSKIFSLKNISFSYLVPIKSKLLKVKCWEFTLIFEVIHGKVVKGEVYGSVETRNLLMHSCF